MKLEEQEYEQYDYSYDRKILDLIKKSDKPLSSLEISLITGIRHDRVCKKLTKLKKYRIVELSTSKKVNFWKAK